MSPGPASGIPARGGGLQPKFPKGHLLSVRSGHRSPRVYGALAAELAAGLIESRPDLGEYPEAVDGWSSIEARALLLRRHIEEVGVIDPESGEPRKEALRWLYAYERQAAQHRAVLGLDPRSEASLARDRAAAVSLTVDLEALAERGRQALAARDLEVP